MSNRLIMQYYEWYLEPDGQHWNRAAADAEHLASLGFTDVWLPPAYKGHEGAKDVGYGVYDLYDLGEFDQKNTVRTKYGTKDEYLNAIRAFREHGMDTMADIVLNHRMGADYMQLTRATAMDEEDHLKPISESMKIPAETGFVFPGRNGKYSTFEWNIRHFNAVGYNPATGKTGVYKLDGRRYATKVDGEKHNYDFLMGANVDYSIAEVREEMIRWGKWYLDFTGVNSLRLDALKHISYDFFPEWLEAMQSHRKQKCIEKFRAEQGREPREGEISREEYEMFAVGEYWSSSLDVLRTYLGNVDRIRQLVEQILEKRQEEVGHKEFWEEQLKQMRQFLVNNTHNMSLFDVPLRHKFEQISKFEQWTGRRYDMTQLFDHTLVKEDPNHAVTFVDNHDTEPGQPLYGWVDAWFKPLAYAVILLREKGTPCVFYGDLYGVPAKGIGPVQELETLLMARKWFGWGWQNNEYINHESTIGWTREGGLAVLMSNGDNGYKRMHVGAHRAGQVYVDMLGKWHDEVVIDSEGFAEFHCVGHSVSVWVPKHELEQKRK